MRGKERDLITKKLGAVQLKMEEQNYRWRHWVDALKAVGITMVLAGHTLGLSSSVDQYIYSFHMPLFFFISGLLFSPAHSRESLTYLIRYNTRRLVVPYLLFSVITYIPWFLFTRHLGADAQLNIEPWRPIIGTFYGIGVNGWLQHNAMLWFFPCLFVLHIIWRLLKTLNPRTRTITIIMLAALAITISKILTFRLPWGIEVAFIATPFFAIGQLISADRLLMPTPNKFTFLWVVFFSVIQLKCIELNGRTDMNFLSIGNPLLFYLGALSGVAAISFLMVFIPPNRIITKVAEATIVAFPLHRTLYSVFSAFAIMIVNDLQSFKLSVLGSITYTGAALVISVLLMPMIRKWFPALIGGR